VTSLGGTDGLNLVRYPVL